MTARDFCFWLNGHFKLNGAGAIDAAKADLIRRHLALVFKHEIDPSMGDVEHQTMLNEIHSPSDGTKPSEPAKVDVVHHHHHKEPPVYRC